MIRLPRTRVRALLALGAMSFALPAAAQEPHDPIVAARQHFDRGVELFAASRYAESLDEFQSAWATAPTPTVLYNIGRVQVMLGRPAEAVDALERYLAEAGESASAERREQVAALIAEQQARIGTVRVGVSPADAEVRVDGRVATDATRAPLRLSAGPHTVEAYRDGYRLLARGIVVEAAGTQQLEMTLDPIEAQRPPAKPATSAEGERGVGTARTAGWALAISGAAMAGAGSVLLLVGYRNHQSGIERAQSAAADGDGAAWDDARAAVERADRLQVAGGTVAAVGAAAAIGGAVLLIATKQPVAVAAQGTGVRLAWSW